jgi:hypothetical protein
VVARRFTRQACTRAREGDQGVIRICKATLSGASPGRIWEQTEGLAPVQLRDLAVQLAADPDLTVSVITYDDGRQELEVLHTGPPHHTEHTIDCCRFSRQPEQTPSRTLSIATPAGLQDAVTLVRGVLRSATAP